MKFSIIILTAYVLLIAGCAQTSVVMNDRAPKFPPTEIVDVLYEKPNRKYIEIGLMETKLSAANTTITLPDLIKNMKEKAKSLGADAIIIIGAHQEQTPQGLMYNPYLGGYQTVGGHSMPVVRGIAIKYDK